MGVWSKRVVAAFICLHMTAMYNILFVYMTGKQQHWCYARPNESMADGCDVRMFATTGKTVSQTFPSCPVEPNEFFYRRCWAGVRGNRVLWNTLQFHDPGEEEFSIAIRLVIWSVTDLILLVFAAFVYLRNWRIENISAAVHRRCCESV